MRHETQQWKVCSSLKLVKVTLRPSVSFHGKRRPALWCEIFWNGNVSKVLVHIQDGQRDPRSWNLDMLERIWKQTTPECELRPKRAALHGPNIRDQVLRRAGSSSWWAALSTRRAPAFSSPAPPSSSSASSSSAASTTAGWEGTWERPTGGRSFQVLQTLTPPQTPCILPETLSHWQKAERCWLISSLAQNLSQFSVNLFKKSSVSKVV